MTGLGVVRTGAMECDGWRAARRSTLLALAEDSEPHLRSSGHEGWVGRLTEDRDYLRAVLDWAVAAREAEVALRMAAAE